MSVANRIILIGKGRYEEAFASGILSPGHLIMQDATGKVKVHNLPGGNTPPIFAIEDGLRGYPRNVFDAYAVGDLIPHTIAEKGDVINALVPAGAIANVGSGMVSNGDGTMIVGGVGGRSVLLNSTTAGASQNGTTATTAYAPSVSIPANTLKVGDIINVRAVVDVTAVAANHTLAVSLSIGSVTIAITAATIVLANDVAYIDAAVVVQAVGNASTGLVVADGTTAIGTSGTATARPFFKAPTNLDTTIANTVAINGAWSTNNNGDTSVLSSATVSLSRGGGNALAICQEDYDNSAGGTPAYVAVRVI